AAATDLVLQAGPGAVAEYAVLAIAQAEQLVHQIEGFAHGTDAGVWPEVAPRNRPRPPMQRDPRPLFAGEQYLRIGLVITQGHVVARCQRLDQLVFQQQRFGFVAGHRDVHARHLRQHHHDPPVLRRAVEIAAHTLAQRAGLADIQQGVVFGIHAVDPRRGAQRCRESPAVETAGLPATHPSIGTSLNSPVAGTKRSTAWASVSAIHTTPAASASAPGPCRRRGRSTVESTPPPSRKVRRLPLPASAIHSSGESAPSASASGYCRRACARSPSSQPNSHTLLPTSVCTRSPRNCTERIAEPNASQTYSTCCTATSPH